MTPEERVESLERELSDLRADFATLTGTFINHSGQAQIYRKALLALIAANQSEKVANDLREELARYEAKVVGECLAEGFLEGTQDAQNLILLALDQNKQSSCAPVEAT